MNILRKLFPHTPREANSIKTIKKADISKFFPSTLTSTSSRQFEAM